MSPKAKPQFQGFINTWSSLSLHLYSFVRESLYMCVYIYIPPVTVIATAAALQFKFRVKWNRHQSPDSPQVGWNIAHKIFSYHSGLREATGTDQDCTAPGRRKVQVSNTR